MRHRETVANGNRVHEWGCGDDALARRVAAALPRAHAPLQDVEAGHGVGYAVIWLRPPAGGTDAYSHTVVPESYAVETVDHFANGRVALTVVPGGGDG